MNVLLSGATGLIGQSLGQELVRRGHRVIALTRNPDRAKHTLKFRAEVRRWKNFDVEPEFNSEDQFDAVVHLAGEPVADKRWTRSQKNLIRDSRVMGTRMLAQAVKSHGRAVRVWVQGSATGFYGDTGANEASETSPAGSDFLATVVQDWENESQVFAVEQKHRLVIIRTGIVLSADGGALAKLIDVFSLGVGGRLGNGEQYMSWIHISDLINIFANAIDNHSYSGIINGVAPEPVTNKAFTSKLASALHKREFFPVPKFALKIALGELSNALLFSSRVKSRVGELGYRFEFKTLDQALAGLFAKREGK